MDSFLCGSSSSTRNETRRSTQGQRNSVHCLLTAGPHFLLLVDSFQKKKKASKRKESLGHMQEIPYLANPPGIPRGGGGGGLGDSSLRSPWHFL